MKKVALVLSSGGARGFAHIGAIEELEQQGFEISAIAGTSMGALIGGMYAVGKLEEVKEYMFSLDRKKIVSLVDISLSLNHFVKGDKIINAMKNIVPDISIEELPIPFAAVATNIENGQEVVFENGSLYEAIRASISIPSFFKPMKTSAMTLIDGGVLNPLPLNRVKRTEDDLLVAVNVSAPTDSELACHKRLAYNRQRENTLMLRKILPPINLEVDNNYYSLLSKTFSLMIQKNAELALQLNPPDIVVNIPMNRFGGFDYGKAEKISQTGRMRMREAIIKYNESH